MVTSLLSVIEFVPFPGNSEGGGTTQNPVIAAQGRSRRPARQGRRTLMVVVHERQIAVPVTILRSRPLQLNWSKFNPSNWSLCDYEHQLDDRFVEVTCAGAGRDAALADNDVYSAIFPNLWSKGPKIKYFHFYGNVGNKKGGVESGSVEPAHHIIRKQFRAAEFRRPPPYSLRNTCKRLRNRPERTEQLHIYSLNKNWVLDHQQCKPLFTITFLFASVVRDGCRTNCSMGRKTVG
ncbi:hypothetical protein EVAR_25221_1 [Eumeta japonica]|uniref:Uncharacterized protein n=1 Tax=Eumeta variegata TaxID=151549 RepID=A0A4C1WK76_EUMVA|nr:hypothetical protein EVAR_25221_1 [Eumeta japonica]